MAYCSECGAQTAGDHRFCGACGATVAVSSEAPVTALKTDPEPTSEPVQGTTAVARPEASARSVPAAPSDGGVIGKLIGTALGLAIGTGVTIAFSVVIGAVAKSEPFADYFFQLGDIAFASSVITGLIAGAMVGNRDRSASPTVGRWLAVGTAGIAAAFGLLICARVGGPLSGVVESGFYPMIASSPIPGAVLFVALAAGAGFVGWRGTRGHRVVSISAFGVGAVFISVCAPALWRFYQLLSMLKRP